jgi:hypothetical protein
MNTETNFYKPQNQIKMTTKLKTYKFNQQDGTPAEVKAANKKEAVEKLQNWLGVKIKAADVYRSN